MKAKATCIVQAPKSLQSLYYFFDFSQVLVLSAESQSATSEEQKFQF
jgi:hypothetical protein